MRLSILFCFVATACFGQSPKLVGGGCDGCELMFEGMPKVINDTDTSFAWHHSKKQFVISGVIYNSDGKTPAPGTILYYYQTNQSGLYAPARNQTQARRHGAIRGWVKANAKGEYTIFTILPAPYPQRNIPAHIHMIIKEPQLNEYYIDDILFDDDPLLTTAERSKQPNRAGSGIMMTSEKNGVTYAERNITLGLHIPGYPGRNNAEVASGLSVGENCPAFDPVHFSGPDKGKNRCPMCSYGFDQGIIIWWNNANIETLKSLLKNLDPMIDTYGFKKLRVFAVFVNPERKEEKAMMKAMTQLADQLRLKSCAILYVPLLDIETYNLYQLNLKVDNTILVYRKRKVIDKFINYNSTNPKELLKRLEL